ncbi:filamentous hemagglutinin N-terminal domain-containing protein [Aetokthonos hydrillicola Thurmond2011]|jgi:filamentous hemagglutinin family protein|uniref:Filamentous hemagglutinin N-terminal domain-containing protein n=1 Tax=Aetokthonos hydrillicola Thurmond2011 TaxID=2712845 RepID=A0AAP5IHB7_9CYAN|nr:filamentous hemagglutinin N-terminal domain-containing protein [Aetokthonos hydrillicola]MBO3459506.1 filamentous hemagglutinin N-terminal domain-containing protein [Aetokthonos hydrillicola CCALA 1050]MBW4591069.1 filamentous hemagglutinin N-terminal domain-containing protein [Aetokthonos hydrillicola CCALA 1050]MDR9899460.1 filamentous hemagglutinin N-terminal domain-containing protein [Aetokthonos hydrillicola Thurmond2011]
MAAVWHRLLGFALGSACTFSASSATAQITPDRTLPNNSSVIINGNVFNIIGGTQAGRNLFHSFQQFSVPTGGMASFNNGLDIQNIFSRVTGGSISNIDGIIKANGTANLFFLNPNGIVFGRNARLNVGGSFLATTANAIQFGNLGNFRASDPNNPALLTVNPTALFYNQIAAGASIQNSSTAPAGVAPTGASSSGLRVPDGNSLLLVGGDINMDGGRLRAYGGHIELGGLASPGTVELAVDGNNLSLSLKTQSTRGAVSLTNGANINVSAGDGGSITVNASDLNITGGSSFNAGIAQGLESVGVKAGDITLNATGDIKIDGKGSRIANNVQERAMGNAGNITLFSNSFGLTGGAQLDASTYGQGNAGNVNIKATGAVTIAGIPSGIFTDIKSGSIGRGGNINVQTGEIVVDNTGDNGGISSITYGKGDTGDININTRNLILKNAQIGSDVYGEGNAGTFKVSASRSVELSGEIPGGAQGAPGGIFAQVDVNGKGNAGKMYIETPRLSVSDGSKVQVANFGEGDAGSLLIHADEVNVFDTERPPYYFTGIFATVARDPHTVNPPKGNGGDLTIETRTLSLRNGGQVAAYTQGEGNAGRLLIQASDSVEVTGSNSPHLTIISGGVANSGIGNGGSITIETPQLSVKNGGVIESAVSLLTIVGKGNGVTVNSPGKGGTITINASNLLLNDGQINAATASGDGGNIILNISDYLLLRNDSRISTTAGTRGAGGNGGNITINAPNGFVIATRSENNDITANAFNGSGGAVKINALGIYDFNQRSLQDLENSLGTNDPSKLDPQKLLTNDITAISLTNPTLSGQVNITTPDIDPARGLITLPTITENPPKLVSSSCTAFNETNGGNSFTITGRGGLPPSPYEPLTSSAIWSDTRLPLTTAHQNQPSKHAAKIKPKPIEILPATGWVFNGKGEVTLISSVSNAPSTPTSCAAR